MRAQACSLLPSSFPHPPAALSRTQPGPEQQMQRSVTAAAAAAAALAITAQLLRQRVALLRDGLSTSFVLCY